MTLSALLTALAALTQPAPSCLDTAREAEAAFARGDNAAGVALLDSAEACTGAPAFEAMRAEAAWLNADFEAAGPLAASAIEVWAQAGCARTRDTARLAFIAGASYRAIEEWSLGRYHLWVALRVDDAVGGLSGPARNMAEHQSERFGTSVNDDRQLLDGSFLDPLPGAAAQCAGYPQVRLRGPQSPEGRLFTVLELRTNGAGRVSRVVEIFSHPVDAPDALLQSIRGQVAFDFRTRSQESYLLDPCADRLSRRNATPLCLPGYSVEPEPTGGASD